MKLLSYSVNSIGCRTYSTLKSFHSKHWIQPSVGYDTNIKIFNPITRTEVPLILKRKDTASWYMCGPTVYDSTHIGHGSCFVKQDIIQRILRKHFQINVVTAMNITDIDDKIIARSKQTNEDWMSLTKRYEDEFWMDMKRLGIETPNISLRVTDHIPEIIQFTQTLLDKQIAYRHSDGSVYFDVYKCPTYGKFQSLNEQSKHEFKRSQFDFAVWKAAKPNEPSWNAPWGSGRPGWHVECSVLASLIFGQNLDFHSGGIDLRFPHHENEEAQCCSHHGIGQWVNYWIHTGQLHLVGESVKMSKSLNNAITVSDFLTKHTANEFRMLCLLSHYRNQMDYSESHMDIAKMTCKRITEFRSNIDACVKGHKTFSDDSNELYEQMTEASNRIDAFLRDDFTTSLCIDQLMLLIKKINKSMHRRDATTNTQPSASSNIADLLAVKNFVDSKLDIFGVNFSDSVAVSDNRTISTERIVDGVVDIRNRIRNRALESKDKQLLKDCDDIRDCFKLNGIALKDHGKLSSWNFIEGK
ncbi:hypothetical protein HA402_002755 [Bradysia odoriphaga]|nr:hypothetical protein HA402_002755 [Bradysia odoriphaga]